MKHNVIDFLTPKQLAFCNEYLIDMNATRAALRAGYSASTALNGQLMNMPKIKLYLQEKMGDAAQKAQVSHARVLNELCKIAFGNMGNFFAADGSIKPMNEVSDDDKAALWSVSVGDVGSGSKTTAGDVVKFRMYNKLSALDKIAKHIGFYVPEPQEAQTIYSYVTTKDINADDSFDDEILAKEIEVMEKIEEEEVAGCELRVAGEDEELIGEGEDERTEMDLVVEHGGGVSVVEEVEDVEVVKIPEVERLVEAGANPYHFSLPPIGQRLKQERGDKYAWMRR